MVVTGENGLGHESAGVVVGVGESVTRFKPGTYYSPLHPGGRGRRRGEETRLAN